MKRCCGVGLLLCVFLVLGGVGCQSTHVAADRQEGGSYELRPMFSHYRVDLTQEVQVVYKATLKGFEDLQIIPELQRVDGLSGLVSGKLADGTNVSVQMGANKTGGTSLRIKIGNVANEATSTAVFMALKKYL